MRLLDRTFPRKRLVKRRTRRLRGNVLDVTAGSERSARRLCLRHERAFVVALRGGRYLLAEALPDSQLAGIGSIVLLGTQPSRPKAFRTQVQPLGLSITSTVSNSPTAVASSVVS
jgi:hypothetical protein